MTNEKFIKIANRVIKDKIFQYKGHLLYGSPIETTIEFKLKLVGNKTLVSVGQPKNYIALDITVVNIEPKFFSHLIIPIENNQSEIGKHMYSIKKVIEDYLSSVLKVFGIYDPPVLTSIRKEGLVY